MNKLLEWIKRPSISKKLFLSFLLVLTVPILALSFSAYQTAGSTLESEIMRSARDNVEQLNEIIDQNIEKKKMQFHISATGLMKSSIKKRETLR